MTPLHPDVLQMIKKSCTPLLERQDQFHQDFHRCLVELMPDSPVMQEADGENISRWLVECVFWGVFSDDPLPLIGATLQGIGLDAHRLGFPRDGYQAVGHALLRTLRGIYPLDWTGAMSSAWIGYHSWLCDFWLSGAEIGALEEMTQPATQPGGQPMMHYAEPQGQYAEPQGHYAEPQGQYVEPQGQYAEPQGYYAEPPSPPDPTQLARPVPRGGATFDPDDDEDEHADGLTYGEIMVGMTLGSNKNQRQH